MVAKRPKKTENFHEFSPPRQGGAHKLTNALMKGGKRATAERLVRRACALFKSRRNAIKGSLIHQAIRNVKPLIELRGPARANARGSRVKPKAVPILPARAEKLAIEWIIQGARRSQGSERTMSLCLYLELLNASQNKGYAIGRRQELHAHCRMNLAVTALRPPKA